VQLADEAVCIGPSSPLESYLNIDAIVKAAKDTRCDAVHPGYGFLAENADFAAALATAGIAFIGPAPDIIRAMGSKIESRRMMRKAGLPIVPGTIDGSDNIDDIVAETEKVELPLFLKASAGGGGKGMRLVTDRSQIRRSAQAAIGEARASFGDGTVYVEQRVDKPRHIEFQVLADNHGNAVHLFERECSIQRRHQKLLEETPSAALDGELRNKMGRAAVKAVETTGYTNVGTIEFLLDEEKNFYFLEMNTRIQVEHPVTEMTTGVDLVKWQILIAQGERLSFGQGDVCKRGHAIECRIYAEDPRNHFLPSCGVVEYLREPWGPGIRNDSGIYQGCEVSQFYDPILSKLVTYDETRDRARRKMIQALDEYVIHGIHTTIEVHEKILRSQAFIKGEMDTDFLDAHLDGWFTDSADLPDEAFVAAALTETLLGVQTDSSQAASSSLTPWQRVGKWEIGGGS